MIGRADTYSDDTTREESFGGLSWRRVCSIQIWLPRPPRGAALWRRFCVYKSRTFRQTAGNAKCQDFHFDAWVHNAPPYTFFWHFQMSRRHAAPRETANAEERLTGQSPQWKCCCVRGKILQGLLIERTSCAARAVTATSSEQVFLTVPLQSHSEVKKMNWKRISSNLEIVISSAIPLVSKHQCKIKDNHHHYFKLSYFKKSSELWSFKV